MKVLFFSLGTADNINTWSNVPFCFTRALRERGIQVIPCNLMPPSLHILQVMYKWTVGAALYLAFHGHDYWFERTRFYGFFAGRIINRYIKNHSDADLCIFCGYEFSNNYNDIPVLLFSDWSFETLLSERKKRNPHFFEKDFIMRQKKSIAKAQFVVSLFPHCAQLLKEENPSANVLYLNRNVVNTVYEGVTDEGQIIDSKSKSDTILIIGKPWYRDGARRIIDAAKELLDDGGGHIAIVGMSASDFSELPDYVKCYGYLHKDVTPERELYYRLVLNAKVVINPVLPDNLLGGYSSMVESMYYYTPVIVVPHKDIVAEFGSDIDFGFYTDFSEISLRDCIKRVLCAEKKDYEQLCRNAHNCVRDYTWSAYVDALLSVIEKS